jgi:hypothetical protein
VSIRVLRVFINNGVEVFHSLLMHSNHLVSFCSFVDVPDIGRHEVDAAAKWEDCLFKLLLAAVSYSDMVEDVVEVSWIWIVSQSFFKRFETLLVFFVGKVCQTKLVENLRVCIAH